MVDTRGFRLGKLLDYRDPRFLPGGAKSLDLPGMLALGAPHPLGLAGEGSAPAPVSAAYRATGQMEDLTTYDGEPSQKENAAIRWLLKEQARIRPVPPAGLSLSRRGPTARPITSSPDRQEVAARPPAR